MDPIEQIVDRLTAAAATLNMPIDRDRPFDPDQDELPRVSVWTGMERTVPPANGGPAAAWAEEVEVSPVVEVRRLDDEPDVVMENIRAAWRTLRAALRAEDWTRYTVGGSMPDYEKTGLQIEDKPGISGFAVTLTFRVELD